MVGWKQAPKVPSVHIIDSVWEKFLGFGLIYNGLCPRADGDRGLLGQFHRRRTAAQIGREQIQGELGQIHIRNQRLGLGKLLLEV